jgi:hypothetical protein
LNAPITQEVLLFVTPWERQNLKLPFTGCQDKQGMIFAF